MPEARLLVAALLTALAVKLLDDLVDSSPDDDLYASRAAYCSLSLCVACLAAASTAVPLFLACYATGMLFKPQSDSRNARLRFAESSGVILVLVVGCGLGRGAAAVLLACFAQLEDDVLDSRADLGVRPCNLAHRFGVVECALLGAACLLAAACLECALAACALAGAVAVWAMERALASRQGGGCGW